MSYKKRDLTYDVTGKSASDLAKISYTDLRAESLANLKAIANRLVSAANKRIRRNIKAGIEDISPAMKNITEEFSIKPALQGKNKREALLKTITDIQQFYNYKSSTIQGFNKYKKETYKRITGKNYKTGTSPFSSIKKERDFWKAYNIAMEKLPEKYVKDYGSTQIQQMLFTEQANKTSKRLSPEEVSDKLADALDIKKAVEEAANSNFLTVDEVGNNDEYKSLGGNGK